MIYISAIRNDGVDPFNMSKKEIHVTIKCNKTIDAVWVFITMTGTTKFRDVVMSTSIRKPDTNLYDTDVMSADEFMLAEI